VPWPRAALRVGSSVQRGGLLNGEIASPSGRRGCAVKVIDGPDPFPLPARYWPKPLVVSPGLEDVAIRIKRRQLPRRLKPRRVDLRAAQSVGPNSDRPQPVEFELQRDGRAWQLSFQVLLLPGQDDFLELDAVWPATQRRCGYPSDASWIFHVEAAPHLG
jgi:hypothetical protein